MCNDAYQIIRFLCALEGLPEAQCTQLIGKLCRYLPRFSLRRLDHDPNDVVAGKAQSGVSGDRKAVYRLVMADLTCGNGQLLAGAAAPGTFHRLGCDIEALPDDPNTLWAPASRRALFRPTSPCWPTTSIAPTGWWIVSSLNFPFDHHWYRDRVAFLGESYCRAVEMAFFKHDGRTSEDTIDSTVAGLCLALDRCSPWVEGYIIANHNTVSRPESVAKSFGRKKSKNKQVEHAECLKWKASRFSESILSVFAEAAMTA